MPGGHAKPLTARPSLTLSINMTSDNLLMTIANSLKSAAEHIYKGRPSIRLTTLWQPLSACRASEPPHMCF